MANIRAFQPHRASLVSAIAIIAALLLASPRSAQAQVSLVDAQPSPGASLPVAPSEVRLVFNRPLLAAGLSLEVLNEAGERIDLGDTRIDPENPMALAVTLPLLYEGKFTVRYAASLLGSSITLADAYEFTLDLPDPVVNLVSPANGKAFEVGPIPIRLETQYVDFGAYNRRIRVYVDGALHTEMQGLRATVDGLAPGVHEIRSVLIQLDDQEVADTSTTVYIAVMEPGATNASPPLVEPPLPVPSAMRLSVTVGLAMIGALMLVTGLWLGRLREAESSSQRD